MKKIYLTGIAAAIALATSFSASADILTPEQALNRARGEQALKQIPSFNPQTLSLVATTTATDDLAALYLFANPREGFIIVSADDCAPAVLGYSAEGRLDVEGMPENMRGWLEEYAAQIAFARSEGLVYAAPTRAARAEIEPMVGARWNQNSPYNDACPEFSGKKTYTGCVATALAMVMKYFGHPAKGSGTVNYVSVDPSSASRQTTINVDLSKASFDWDAMTNTYTSSATSSAKTAVADMMFNVAAAIHTSFGTATSSAKSVHLPIYVADNLGYNQGAQCVRRDFYYLTPWDDFVYDQLATYGPLVYCGSTEQGAGHAFVCDGYSTDGYFHINWGWSGSGDGYYLLDALKPDVSGIGGAGAGKAYNYDQDVLAYLNPTTGPKERVDGICGFNTKLSIIERTAKRGETLTVNGAVADYSQVDCDINIGLILKGLDAEYVCPSTDVVKTVADKSLPFSVQATIPADLPDGPYIAYPAFKSVDGSNWNYMYWTNTIRYCYGVVVANGEASISTKIPEELGVEPAVVDEAEASERWFTLQGREVKIPDCGGVYIRLRGSKAEKVIL